MENNKLTPKIVFLIVLMVVLESFAVLLMKEGLITTGVAFEGIENLFAFFSANIVSLFIWLGIFIYLINFIIWITALHKVELSIAYPVTSVIYIIVPVFSIIFLGEYVPLLRWIGIALIIAGIYFVSKSSKNEAGQRC